MNTVKELFRFIKHIYTNKSLLYLLSAEEFKEQYLGSYFGVFWALIRPSLFALVIWIIFSLGFKGDLVDSDVPFIVYLLTGYVPWFFFSEAITGGMNSVVNNKFFVKKVAFRVSILPIVKIISLSFLHILFVLILIIVLLLNGIKPTIYWLQFPFYLFSMIMLLLGISWLTSALRVFVKDIAQIVSILLQVGFWLSPIFWSLKILPEKYILFLQLNPMVYIIDGYRNSFINGIWFWEHNGYVLLFWFYVISFFIIGGIVFKRLRPHFGDVL